MVCSLFVVYCFDPPGAEPFNQIFFFLAADWWDHPVSWNNRCDQGHLGFSTSPEPVFLHPSAWCSSDMSPHPVQHPQHPVPLLLSSDASSSSAPPPQPSGSIFPLTLRTHFGAVKTHVSSCPAGSDSMSTPPLTSYGVLGNTYHLFNPLSFTRWWRMGSAEPGAGVEAQPCCSPAR